MKAFFDSNMYLILISLIIVLLIVVLWLSFRKHPAKKETKHHVDSLTAAGLLITIIVSFFSYTLENDKMQKELFNDFNDRFDKLNNNLNKIYYDTINSPDIKISQNKNDSITNVLNSAIYDYINLCAEEYYWYSKRKRLPSEAWDTWEMGMIDYLSTGKIYTIYQMESNIYSKEKGGYYSDFFISMNEPIQKKHLYNESIKKRPKNK